MSNHEFLGLELEYNLSEAKASDPLPEGLINCSIEEIEFVAAKSKKREGETNLVMTLFIHPDDFPPEYATNNPNSDGVKLKRYVALSNSADAVNRIKLITQAINNDESILKTKKITPEFFLNNWLGRSAVVKVTHESYENRMVARAGSFDGE